MTVRWHGQFRERGGPTRTLDSDLSFFGHLRSLGECVWLARPAANGQSFEDVVVDLAGAGAVGTFEVSPGARGPELEEC